MGIETPAAIIAYWREAGPDRWFKKDSALDNEIKQRFLATYEAAAAGKLTSWESSAEGALALLILFDQFPRNMFRGETRAFATDALARAVASRAVLNGFDGAFPDMRGFFYLPFTHSENLADQQRGVALYRAVGDDDGLKWAETHADIIRRFGRFPHRNAVLGRITTPEEQKFLEEGSFSG
jgi:uncharacterized protein (DUF924 family)